MTDDLYRRAFSIPFDAAHAWALYLNYLAYGGDDRLAAAFHAALPAIGEQLGNGRSAYDVLAPAAFAIFEKLRDRAVVATNPDEYRRALASIVGARRGRFLRQGRRIEPRAPVRSLPAERPEDDRDRRVLVGQLPRAIAARLRIEPPISWSDLEPVLTGRSGARSLERLGLSQKEIQHVAIQARRVIREHRHDLGENWRQLLLEV